MRTCVINMEWDDGVWCAESDDDLGIVLESESFDVLIERVRAAVPEMLALNLNYTDEVQIIFNARRTDTMKAVG